MLEDLLGVLPKGGEIVCAKLLARSIVSRWQGVLVGILTTEIGHATGLGRVKVKLKPLVAGTKVVDLETPSTIIAFIAEFAFSSVSANSDQVCSEIYDTAAYEKE